MGWTDEQQGEKYHLRRREDDAYFGYNLGPHAWKSRRRPCSGKPNAPTAISRFCRWNKNRPATLSSVFARANFGP